MRYPSCPYPLIQPGTCGAARTASCGPRVAMLYLVHGEPVRARVLRSSRGPRVQCVCVSARFQDLTEPEERTGALRCALVRAPCVRARRRAENGRGR